MIDMTNEELKTELAKLKAENEALKAKATGDVKFDEIVKFIYSNRAKYKSNRLLAKAIATETGLCSESSAFHYLSMQRYVDAVIRYELSK
jgi:hypothetical protein